MYVTLAGMVTLVSEVAPSNALKRILVTPSGITTAPTQEYPLVTTPLVIVKLGVELEASNSSPVVQV